MHQNSIIDDRITTFWEQQEKFRNNPLKTELPNAETYNLSDLAKTNPLEAINSIRKVDAGVFEKMFDYLPEMRELQKQVVRTFEAGNKVYICGCGASGRLAVLMEFIWNSTAPDSLKGKVIGFLAGGDSALIKSLEGFEDHKDFGVKQLELSGFRDGDLLLAATASGESPFVIGAAEKAAETSVKPWFIHCNTNDALKGRIKDHIAFRSDVNVLSLYTGQMALTGSTRMQATTALMLGMWLPLGNNDIKERLGSLFNSFRQLDFTPIAEFVVRETEIYRKKEFIFYETEPRYGITVLTDTTERSPTFNLTPFENQTDKKPTPSWCYLLFPESRNSEEAWNDLLGRAPRALEWDEDTSLGKLYGFNFSKELESVRTKYASPSHYFKIKKNGDSISFSLDSHEASFRTGSNLFAEHLLLKLLLNTSSTVIMGRMGFYEGNMMTSLYPSNSKLIDRAIRYIDFILSVKHHRKTEYNDIAGKMFIELKKLKAGESIVLRTVDAILNS